MSKYIETVWKLQVNGQEFDAERTEHANMTVYTVSRCPESRATVFTDRELPALQAFLTALATDPGTRVVRCKYCDEPLQFATCSVNGVEVPDDYDGPWVGDSGSSRCEESPKANEAWPKAHYPRKSDICIIKDCKRFRTSGVTCEQHEKIEVPTMPKPSNDTLLDWEPGFNYEHRPSGPTEDPGTVRTVLIDNQGVVRRVGGWRLKFEDADNSLLAILANEVLGEKIVEEE